MKPLNELLLLVGHLKFAQVLLFFKGGFRADQEGLLALEGRWCGLSSDPFPGARGAFSTCVRSLNHQIEFDILDVAQGIDGPTWGIASSSKARST